MAIKLCFKLTNQYQTLSFCTSQGWIGTEIIIVILTCQGRFDKFGNNSFLPTILSACCLNVLDAEMTINARGKLQKHPRDWIFPHTDPEELGRAKEKHGQDPHSSLCSPRSLNGTDLFRRKSPLTVIILLFSLDFHFSFLFCILLCFGTSCSVSYIMSQPNPWKLDFREASHACKWNAF